MSPKLQSSIKKYFSIKSNVTSNSIKRHPMEKCKRKPRLSLRKHEPARTITVQINSNTSSSEDDPKHFLNYDNINNETTFNQLQKTISNDFGNEELKDEVVVIESSSDEEKFINNDTLSDQSEKTIIYSRPNTPQKILDQSTSLSSPSSRSPKKKYYSPNKKKLTTKKRNLNKEYGVNDKTVNSFSFTTIENYTNLDYIDDKTFFFIQLINNVLDDKDTKNLFDEISQAVLLKIQNLKNIGSFLVLRLFWWKDRWHKEMELKDKIQKGINNCTVNKPIGDEEILCMLKDMQSEGLINSSESDVLGPTFDELVEALKAKQLLQVCNQFNMKATLKHTAAEMLRNFCNRKNSMANFIKGCNKLDNENRVINVMKKMAGPCYKLSSQTRVTIHKLYVIMFLGVDYNIIRDKNLELMLINDKAKIETYPISKEVDVDGAKEVFKNNGDFESYYKSLIFYDDYLNNDNKEFFIREAFRMYIEIDEIEMKRYKSYPIWLHRYTPPNIYVKIMHTGLVEIKKLKKSDFALDMVNILLNQHTFCQHKRELWCNEKVMLLCNMKKHDEAAEFLLDSLKSNLPPEHKTSLKRRAKRLAGQKNISLTETARQELMVHATDFFSENDCLDSDHFEKQPMEQFSRGKKKFETRNKDGMTVREAEEYCIELYLTSEQYGHFTHGQHWEGRIINTIFFLIFWDIIYSKPIGVKGIFLCRFQRYPQDMFTESFYTNRKTMIEEKLSVVENSCINILLDEMHNVWDKRPESEMSGLCRSNMLWGSVREVSECLGPRALAVICRRLAQDYRRTHSGFPDLTLWNPQTKKIQFVEVKTDSDTPSEKQLQWINYLRLNGIRAKFCYIGADTKRNRARNNPCNDHFNSEDLDDVVS